MAPINTFYVYIYFVSTTTGVVQVIGYFSLHTNLHFGLNNLIAISYVKYAYQLLCMSFKLASTQNGAVLSLPDQGPRLARQAYCMSELRSNPFAPP